MADIRYTRFCNALGRNGIMQQLGLSIEKSAPGDSVWLYPINTRGIGRCFMEIPTQDLDKVIKVLEGCKNG